MANRNVAGTRRGVVVVWKEKAEELFDGWDASLLHAYFAGGMGSIMVDDKEQVMAALIDVGDFCFLTGMPNERLLEKISGFKLLIPRDLYWEYLIEDFYGNCAQKITRYAIQKVPDRFDHDKLSAYVSSLDAMYELRLFDQEIFKMAQSEEWSSDLCSQFVDYEAYKNNAVGVAILHQGKLISGASPYAVYPDGIEIEIDTKPEYRLQGLATICGAALILECLNRGLYPGWDAHDLRSLALAEKLGYQLKYPYTAYALLKVAKD